jgi:hypothetical protein
VTAASGLGPGGRAVLRARAVGARALSELDPGGRAAVRMRSKA